MKHKVTLALLTVLLSLLMFRPVGALQPQTDITDFPPGTSIFVNASNVSGIEDGTLSHPFNTIQEGINAAGPYQRVGVAGGTYYENIQLKANVDLMGMSPATTIIDGGGVGTVVIMEDASVLRRFTIQHGQADFGGGIVAIGQPIITNNIIQNNVQNAGGSGAAIHGNNSSPVITYNLIRDNIADTQYLSGALSFINSSSPYIASNVIVNNSGRGAINLTIPSGYRPTVVNNTIINNPGGGLKVDIRADQSAIHVANNILVGNLVGVQMDFGPVTNLPVFSYNDVYGNSVNFLGMSDISGTNGNVSLDPLFADEFHLRSSSPLIDVGSTSEYSVADFDGNARPLDGNNDGIARSDIGADEYFS